jgi:hypothetical protein
MTQPVSTVAVQRPVAGAYGQGSIPWAGISIDFLGDGPCARKGEAPVVRSDLYGTCVERLDLLPMLLHHA